MQYVDDAFDNNEIVDDDVDEEEDDVNDEEIDEREITD